MGFTEAVRTCFEKYVDVSGRAQRSEYWWFTLFIVVVMFVLTLIDGLLGLVIGAGYGLLSTIFWLAILLPAICVSVRRLHDINRTGWWLLINFVPVIGFIVLLVFFIQRGTEGPNRFGPDPSGGSEREYA